VVQKILSQMPSYPEGAVSIEQMRTSFHAAAYCGNAQKLDLLMKDFKARVERSNYLTKEQQKAVFSKLCIVPILNA